MWEGVGEDVGERSEDVGSKGLRCWRKWGKDVGGSR